MPKIRVLVPNLAVVNQVAKTLNKTLKIYEDFLIMKMRLNFKKISKHPPTMVGNVYLGSSSLPIVKTYLWHLDVYN
jgi:hypothetical protein